MKQRSITVSILETVTDEQFEDILSIFRIVEGVCGAELVRELPPTPKRPPQYPKGHVKTKPEIPAGIPHGYQPTNDNLDISNPPQNSSGVPKHKAAVTCPVCYGTGHVDAGFYLQTQGSSSAGGTEPCRSCNGNGFLVI